MLRFQRVKHPGRLAMKWEKKQNSEGESRTKIPKPNLLNS